MRLSCWVSSRRSAWSEAERASKRLSMAVKRASMEAKRLSMKASPGN